MDCPRCSASLKSVDVKSASVDRCPRCQGSWYDAGELRLLKDRAHHGDYRWIDVDLWHNRDLFSAGDQQELACPRCGETMTTVGYSDSGIAVNICTGCRGTWADGGDFSAILDALEEHVNRETVGEYLADIGEEFVEIFTGPEGVGSELADLAKVLSLLQLRFAVQFPDIAGAIRSIARGTPGST